MHAIIPALVVAALALSAQATISWLLRRFERPPAVTEGAHDLSAKTGRTFSGKLLPFLQFSGLILPVAGLAGFTFLTIGALNHDRSRSETSKPPAATQFPSTSEWNDILLGGLVPGIQDLQRFADTQGLTRAQERRLTGIVASLKGHILEYIYLRSKTVRSEGVQVDSCQVDTWFMGPRVYSISRFVLSPAAGSDHRKYILRVPIAPRMSPGDCQALETRIRIDGKEDHSALNITSEDSSSALDNVCRATIVLAPRAFVSHRAEVTIEHQASQGANYSLQDFDVRPFHDGIGRLEMTLHFLERPIDVRIGRVRLDQTPEVSWLEPDELPAPWRLVATTGPWIEGLYAPAAYLRQWTLGYGLSSPQRQEAPVVSFWQATHTSPTTASR